MWRGPGLGVLHFTACNSDTNFISTQNIVIQHHWPLLAKLWTSRSWSAVIRSLAWYFLHTNWPNWAGCCWKRHSSAQEICVGVWSWSRRRASSCSVCCVSHAKQIYVFFLLFIQNLDTYWVILLIHTIVPTLITWPPDQSCAVCWCGVAGGPITAHTLPITELKQAARAGWADTAQHMNTVNTKSPLTILKHQTAGSSFTVAAQNCFSKIFQNMKPWRFGCLVPVWLLSPPASLSPGSRNVTFC